MLIYRMISKEEWNQVKNQNYYEPEELERDGFIHFSFKEQLVGVANAVYKEFDELVVLEVDIDKLEYPDKLKVEDLYDYKVNYPHFYSKLNMSAVISDFLMINTDNGFEYSNA